MSIGDQIRTHIGRELFLLQPAFSGEETPRTIFLSREVDELREGAWSNSKDAGRLATALAVLEDFVTGGVVSVAEYPFRKSSRALLARLHPVAWEFWAFRCIDPRPGIRVLGGFAGRAIFIALTWEYRENFDSEQLDGGWGGNIIRCRNEWTRLFGDTQPHKARTIDGYVGFNSYAS